MCDARCTNGLRTFNRELQVKHYEIILTRSKSLTSTIRSLICSLRQDWLPVSNASMYVYARATRWRVVIPLVPTDAPTLISSLLRLSGHHLALAASASQPLKSGTLSLYLSVPVPVLIPFVVTSRPTTASRHSNPLNPSPLAPQIRLCRPLCAFINYIY